MTPQEILASLSRLEAELNEVASARLLVEQTANSYKEVQKELRSFIGEFQIITSSLNTIANALHDGKASLVTESIKELKVQLETIHNSLSSHCNSLISRFVESIDDTSEQFKSKTSELTADYTTNNESFKASIKELDATAASIKQCTSTIVAKQAEHEAKTVQAISDIATVINAIEQLHSTINNKMDGVESKLENLSTTASSVKVLTIVNIVVVIIAFILLFVK